MTDSIALFVVGVIMVGGFALMLLPRLSTLSDKRRRAGARGTAHAIGEIVERDDGRLEVFLGTNVLRAHVIAGTLKDAGRVVDIREHTITTTGTSPSGARSEASLLYRAEDEDAVRAEIKRVLGL